MWRDYFLYGRYRIFRSVLLWRNSDAFFEDSAEIERVDISCGAGDLIYSHFRGCQHFAGDLKALGRAENTWGATRICLEATDKVTFAHFVHCGELGDRKIAGRVA